MQFRHTLRSILLGYNVWLDKTIARSEVRDFVRGLHPMLPAKPLMRLGNPDGDGGYIVPDDLDGLSGMISPGVSDEVGFDLKMAERGLPVFLCDARIDCPPQKHSNFHFLKKYVDTYNSDLTITLDDFAAQAGNDGDLMLQMDIEGAEYRVIHAMSDQLLRRFRIMVFEFHDVSSVFTRCGMREIAAAFAKLRQHHHIVHIHPNNAAAADRCGDLIVPPLLEITFYRKDRDVFSPSASVYPLAIDRDNTKHEPAIPLPPNWLA